MNMPNDMVKFAMKPTAWVVFLRTFFLYQLYRFVWVNVRMLMMIAKSHAHGVDRPKRISGAGAPSVPLAAPVKPHP